MAHRNTKKRNGLLNVANVVFCCALSMMCGFMIVRADEINEDDIKEAEKSEDKIESLEDKLKDAKIEKNEDVQKKLIISNELHQINGNISIIGEKLSESEKEVNRTKLELDQKRKEIEYKKKLLADILRKINQVDSEAYLMTFGSDNGFGDYFTTIDALQQLEKGLYDTVEEIKNEKVEFEKKREEQEIVVEIYDDQQKTLEYEKVKKSVILNQTQGEINQKNAVIDEIQSKIARLRANISRLLGKGYDTGDIKDAVKFASKATGVRKDFLMGMLVVESDLGRYTGGCNYKESRMNSYRKSIFKDICKDLDYNYKKQKVSCPPSGYKGTGGAMGVAQFMSDTWKGYEKKIERVTGHKPPDPWDLTDGVTAMALKLANDGATSKKGECKAAKRYLGGSHQWYCDKVQYWADHYEKLLE
ncbi:MAG: lytic murein transglycosylase [Patescibacteria group bacterium]|nr:lytic murein transglycosylase [Patescibacteria group bacterium]